MERISRTAEVVAKVVVVISIIAVIGHFTTPKEHRDKLYRLTTVEHINWTWWKPWTAATAHMHFRARDNGEFLGYTAPGKQLMQYGPCPHCTNDS
jgi:hypothetical protein